MSKFIKGGKLMVFAKMGSESTYTSIGYATNHSLSLSATTADITTKDNGGEWTEEEITKRSWSITTENLMAATTYGHDFDDLYSAFVSGAKVKLQWGNAATGTAAAADVEVPSTGWTPKSSGADATLYEGDAIITALDVNAQNGENVSYTATLQGVGKFSPVAASVSNDD